MKAATWVENAAKRLYSVVVQPFVAKDGKLAEFQRKT
jgi:hypothetical protein